MISLDRRHLALPLAAGCALLAACTAPAPTPAGRAASAGRNPVLDENFPDPAVLRAADGMYFAYATQGEAKGRMHNIQLARSRDLVAWEHIGDALPDKPAWASRTQDFWAPHVSEHAGRYYLYYSAKPDAALENAAQGLCLGVATARRPEGPFRDTGTPLQCGESFVNIDPMAFDDLATGKSYLYWGSGFGPIKVRELAADRVSFAPGSAAIDLVPVIAGEDAANYQRLVEGAWVTRHGEHYYLFYSGDNCCGEKAHYAVMVARARSATGPFETLAAATGAASSVILARDERWIAPGHNAVIEDERGQHWTLYHAVDARRPREKEADEINTRRVMLLGRVEWADGWPRIVPLPPRD
jgi:arabinan endo-1,5-alpha-L-arabinosidase